MTTTKTMTHAELKQAAIDCLAKAFSGDPIPSHVVQAAVSIVLTPSSDTKDGAANG